MNMELLTEFTASHSPNYKHGTPDGVQHSKCPNSSLPAQLVDRSDAAYNARGLDPILALRQEGDPTNCVDGINKKLKSHFNHTRIRLYFLTAE